MKERVLVTGGAGFIGSHLVDALVRRGYRVRVFDNLDPQIHGRGASWPAYRNPNVEYIRGDVRHDAAVNKALRGVSVVVHKAGSLGVEQSMSQIKRFVLINSLGAAVLLEAILKRRGGIRKMIVASSMGYYGEGTYHCSRCGDFYPSLRPRAQLNRHDWEMRCPICGSHSRPIPTAELRPSLPTSVYSITKIDHEQLFLSVGRAYQIPAVALRYFNVFGPRQSLSSPYSGVIAIFASSILRQIPPTIYEDGLQTRDFVHINDVVQSNLLALESADADYQAFNVGSGSPTTILGAAQTLTRLLGFDKTPNVSLQSRKADIRHCYADITKITKALGFKPRMPFEKGMRDLLSWLQDHALKPR